MLLRHLVHRHGSVCIRCANEKQKTSPFLSELQSHFLAWPKRVYVNGGIMVTYRSANRCLARLIPSIFNAGITPSSVGRI